MATKTLSSDTQPTMQHVIPSLLKLERTIEADEEDPPVIRNIKAKMREELEARSQDRYLALLAVILNPKTKALGFPPASEVEKAQGLLFKEVKEVSLTPPASPKQLAIKQEPVEEAPASLPSLPTLALDSATASSTDQPPLPQLQPTTPEVATVKVEEDSMASKSASKKPKLQASCSSAEELKADDWLQDIICTEVSCKPTGDMAKQEVIRYINSHHKDAQLPVLDWWRANGHFYPRISSITKKVLAIPASSVSSERVFSLAGMVVDKKRAKLNPNHVNTLIFLGKNATYWCKS